MVWQYVIPAAISIGGSLLGGSKASSAAKDQAKASNEATERQHEYDLQAYEMAKQKLAADHDVASQEVLLRAQNERTLADYKDAQALQRYNYDLMIRNTEQQSLDQQYWKSDDLYNQQISLNARTAYAGREDEYRALEEIQNEHAFEAQELEVENLLAIGKARARGRTGKSAEKSVQSIIANYGRQQAQMAEAILGAGRNSRAALAEISRDQEAADMAAWAQKMLDPGELPMPLQPLATPVAEFALPRALEEFDFGPEPIKGAMRDPSAAAAQVWGSTITGIAGQAGSMATSMFAKSYS